MEQHKVLYKLRAEKKLSLQKLSDLTGISKSMLGHLETGQRTGTIEVLTKLADFYNVSLDYITGYDETREMVNKFLKDLSKKFDLNDPKVQFKILKALDEVIEEEDNK